MRGLVAGLMLLALAVGGAAYWLFGRDSGEDVAAFFTPSTPTVCQLGTLTIAACNGHFAAFTDGRELAESGHRFLIADISLRNDGSAPVRVTEESLYLTQSPGETHRTAETEARCRSARGRPRARRLNHWYGGVQRVGVGRGGEAGFTMTVVPTRSGWFLDRPPRDTSCSDAPFQNTAKTLLTGIQAA